MCRNKNFHPLPFFKIQLRSMKNSWVFEELIACFDVRESTFLKYLPYDYEKFIRSVFMRQNKMDERMAKAYALLCMFEIREDYRFKPLMKFIDTYGNP